MLRDLDIQPYYRSDQHRLLYDFYEPCLAQAYRYDRAVGYFTSSTLAAAARGLRPFIERDGRMRLVASPHLTEDDVEAIRQGYEAREDVVQRALMRELAPADIPDPVRRRLEFLAWLIAVERLDIRIAVVAREGRVGIYHEKIGIFVDERGDTVVFAGSANESVGGLLVNFEALEVFRSWLPEDVHRVERWVRDFETLWGNQTIGLEVYEFPKAVREQLLERYQPAQHPERDPEAGHIEEAQVIGESRAPFGLPKLPADLVMRDYQKEAVRRWFAGGGRGIWEMATGTGKTFTALAAITQLQRRLDHQGRALAAVVVCPFTHLVGQWADNAAEFGLRAVRCLGSRDSWMPTLGSALAAVSSGEIPFVLVVATNQTFSGDPFQAHLLPYRGDLMLIGDEVHNHGAPTLMRTLPEHAAYRLGLSATPERHFDSTGTSQLFAYFGRTVFTFTLQDAIAAGALVPYRYYPILIELSEDEKDQYLDLTEKIARLAAIGDDLTPESSHGPLQLALFERARLLGNAAGKLPALRTLMTPLATSTHNLVYCADSETTHGALPQLDQAIALLGRDLHMRVSTYTHQTSQTDREERRRRFADGDLQALVAIRCLDEGIDIPEARRGFLLASTTNPRQFVQRRGRLLRRSPGKDRADLYDFVVVPPAVSSDKDKQIWETERRLVGRELLRVIELAEAAQNGPEALGHLLELRKRYHLLGLGVSDNPKPEEGDD